MFKTALHENGLFRLPKHIVERLSLQAGDTLCCHMEDRILYVTPEKEFNPTFSPPHWGIRRHSQRVPALPGPVARPGALLDSPIQPAGILLCVPSDDRRDAVYTQRCPKYFLRLQNCYAVDNSCGTFSNGIHIDQLKSSGNAALKDIIDIGFFQGGQTGPGHRDTLAGGHQHVGGIQGGDVFQIDDIGPVRGEKAGIGGQQPQ